MALVLIGGGARSGKSRYALARARQAGGRLACIATAQPLDAEMAERITAHKRQRGSDFLTIEEPLDLAGALRAAPADAVVIDCLTLWLSNLIHTPGTSLDRHVDAALEALRETTAQVFAVTNEVGSGIVPATALGRAFRDRAGEVNQRFAEAAKEVYLMVFGQPLRVK